MKNLKHYIALALAFGLISGNVFANEKKEMKKNDGMKHEKMEKNDKKEMKMNHEKMEK